MGEHQVSHPIPLGHPSEIAGKALPVVDRSWKTTATFGTKDRVHCRMHENIRASGQHLDLI